MGYVYIEESFGREACDRLSYYIFVLDFLIVLTFDGFDLEKCDIKWFL